MFDFIVRHREYALGRSGHVLGACLDGHHPELGVVRVHVVADDVRLSLLGHVLVDHVHGVHENGVLLGLGGVSEDGHHVGTGFAGPYQVPEHPLGELHAVDLAFRADVRHMRSRGPAGSSKIQDLAVASEGEGPSSHRQVCGELAPPGIPLPVFRFGDGYEPFSVDPLPGRKRFRVQAPSFREDPSERAVDSFHYAGS